MLNKAKTTDQTWAAQVPVEDAGRVVATLRKAGMLDEFDPKFSASRWQKLVALVSVENGLLRAIVATQSGLVYQFEPNFVDKAWWSFVLRHHYIVTGTLEDRRAAAGIAGVNESEITGRALDRRTSAGPSGLLLSGFIPYINLGFAA